MSKDAPKILTPTGEALRVLKAMRGKANTLEVAGVSAVTTTRLILEALQAAGATEKELRRYKELKLIELIREITSNSSTSPALVPILTDIVGRLTRNPDPERDTQDQQDPGTNYAGAALGKLAQMFRTGKNSGVEPVRKGEFGAKGGILGHKVATAFSGGTENQDAQIAQEGIDEYIMNFLSQALRSV